MTNIVYMSIFRQSQINSTGYHDYSKYAYAVLFCARKIREYIYIRTRNDLRNLNWVAPSPNSEGSDLLVDMAPISGLLCRWRTVINHYRPQDLKRDIFRTTSFFAVYLNWWEFFGSVKQYRTLVGFCWYLYVSVFFQYI